MNSVYEQSFYLECAQSKFMKMSPENLNAANQL